MAAHIGAMEDILDELEEMVLGDKAPTRVAKAAVAKAEEALQDIEERNPLRAVFFDKNIRVIGTVKDPLFCAADIARYIGDSNYSTKLKEYVDSEPVGGRFIMFQLMPDKMRRGRKMLYLTENGLYRFLMRSNTTVAAEFQAYAYAVLKEERERMVDSVQLAFKIAQNRHQEVTEQCRLARCDTDRAMRVANDMREENRKLRAQIAARTASLRAKEDARISTLEEANANRSCFETLHRF